MILRFNWKFGKNLMFFVFLSQFDIHQTEFTTFLKIESSLNKTVACHYKTVMRDKRTK